MPFLFECPQCAERRVIAGAAVGHRVRCPACEALVEITLPSPEVDSEARPGLQSPGDATTESAEGLPVYSGVAISAPSLQPDWEGGSPAAVPGVPVLAMADDEDEEERVTIRSKPEESEMDMTPMVDVTFQLLIFFMVTASFTMQKSLKIPAPKETQAAASSKSIQDFEEDPEFVTVRIDQNGTYFISGEKWSDEVECPSEQELLVKLREARQAGGTTASKMLVMAHGDAEHSRVVTAIDAGLSAGIDDVQLLSVEDEGN
jgi:biopolymer transport protein ExbD